MENNVNKNECPHLGDMRDKMHSNECERFEHKSCSYYTYQPYGGCKGDFSEDCFVATACYGKNGYITESLRVWRDRMMNEQNDIAVRFIKFYYSGIGYSTAKVLRKVPVLKIIARWSILLFKRVVNA